MQRERWEQTPLCSLCPGPFFFPSPFNADLKKQTSSPQLLFQSLVWQNLLM